MIGFDLNWNNASTECLFMVCYLTFSFWYLVYLRVQFFVLWFSQCIPVLLQSDIDVKYHLHADDTDLYISLDPDNELNFSSFLNNSKHCIAGIRLLITQNLLKLKDYKINILYLAYFEGIWRTNLFFLIILRSGLLDSYKSEITLKSTIFLFWR